VLDHEAHAGAAAVEQALKQIRGQLAGEAVESLHEAGYGVVEHVQIEVFLAPEVIEQSALGDAGAPDNRVCGSQGVPLLGELLDACVQDARLILSGDAFKVGVFRRRRSAHRAGLRR
jgi:hypothetical protein